jgi:hypothetical protein
VDFTSLPEAIVSGMKGALDAGDLEELEELARSMADEHPAASAVLIELCQAFDYDGLGQRLG